MEPFADGTVTVPIPPHTFNAEDHEIFAVAAGDCDSAEDVAIMIRYMDWPRFRHFKASDVAAIIRRGQLMPAHVIDPKRKKRHLDLLHESYLEAENDEKLFADEKMLTRKARNFILCGYIRTNASTAEIAEVVNRERLMPAPLNKIEAHTVEKIYDYLAVNRPRKIEEWRKMSTLDPEGRRIVEKFKTVVYQADFLPLAREDR
ncbi:MAG: hypothetical protein LQ337_004154 [Flavoplaca oasis]|nr:MAG: hypothetical protein LQ337_004154 [Flavoplaca oasis]